MFSINGTGNAWIFGRDIFALSYAKAEEQIKALVGEAESEGYKVVGTTTIREDINSKKDMVEMEKLMLAARVKRIDAVFVLAASIYLKIMMCLALLWMH